MASLPRTFGRFAAFLAVLSAIAPVGPARAQNAPSGFAIATWKVPDACGEQAHFEERVREAIGDWPENLPVVQVDIDVWRELRNFVLRIRTSAPSGAGQRELRARSCEELLSTGAVVLSLALDSEALLSNEREHEVVTTESDSEPIGSKHESDAKTNQHRGVLDDEQPILHGRDEGAAIAQKAKSREAMNTGLRLVSLVETGTLPRLALGVGLVARAHAAGYSVSFRLMRWAEQVQFIDATDRRGGSFDLLSGSLQICREFSRGRALLGLCAVGSVARISATGIAYTPNSAVNVLASSGIGAFRDILIGPTSIRLRVEGEGQHVRPRYLLNEGSDEERQVHQPHRVAVRMGMSWGMSF